MKIEKLKQVGADSIIFIKSNSTTYPGLWSGGRVSLILQLSQPSLARVGAGAELGNKAINADVLPIVITVSTDLRGHFSHFETW